MNELKLILRWILVIPLSLATSLIAYALIRLGDAFFGALWGVNGIQDFFLDALAHWFSGFIFVLAGTYVAPKFKPKVAILLATMFVLSSIAITFIDLNSYDVFWKSLSFWKELVMIVASIAGSVCAVMVAYDGFSE